MLKYLWSAKVDDKPKLLSLQKIKTEKNLLGLC